MRTDCKGAQGKLWGAFGSDGNGRNGCLNCGVNYTTVEVITQTYTFVKTHQTMYLKWVKFTAHILLCLQNRNQVKFIFVS